MLEQLVPFGGAAELNFGLVSDPLINLNRGRLVQPAQLASLMGSRIKLKLVSGNATSDETPSLSIPARSNSKATAAWEDEGGPVFKMCMSF